MDSSKGSCQIHLYTGIMHQKYALTICSLKKSNSLICQAKGSPPIEPYTSSYSHAYMSCLLLINTPLLMSLLMGLLVHNYHYVGNTPFFICSCRLKGLKDPLLEYVGSSRICKLANAE